MSTRLTLDSDTGKKAYNLKQTDDSLIRLSDIDNRFLFRRILNAQRTAKTCLPFFLGLDTQDFTKLLRYTGGDFSSNEPSVEDTRQLLLELRRDEWWDLNNLLMQHRSGRHFSERWMAAIVAAACFGGDHLWRDLGMDCRQSLNLLLKSNFLTLWKKNDKDMKWKKFFYKQLCDRQGAYVCRAPSCEECTAYDNCFGPEE